MVSLPAIVDPEILVRISADDPLDRLIHLFRQAEYFFSLTLIAPRPKGIGDDGLEVISVLATATGNHYDRPFVQDGKDRRGGSR